MVDYENNCGVLLTAEDAIDVGQNSVNSIGSWVML